jgi:hypothetical protein
MRKSSLPNRIRLHRNKAFNLISQTLQVRAGSELEERPNQPSLRWLDCPGSSGDSSAFIYAAPVGPDWGQYGSVERCEASRCTERLGTGVERVSDLGPGGPSCQASEIARSRSAERAFAWSLFESMRRALSSKFR